MLVNGRDFLEKSLGLTDIELTRLVKTDEALIEILDGEYKIAAEDSHSPETYYEPAYDNFEIIDDSGLMDAIESVSDQKIKSLLLKTYENDVEGGEFDYPEPDDGYADYMYDKRRDDAATGY